jgi:hypothetical protein
MQEALSRAKLRLGKGRTTILGDSDSVELDDRYGGKAHNPVALVSDYGMDSDEDDEDEDQDNALTAHGHDPQKHSDAGDPLASFFDELQHEGLLEEHQAQQPEAATGKPLVELSSTHTLSYTSFTCSSMNRRMVGTKFRCLLVTLRVTNCLMICLLQLSLLMTVGRENRYLVQSEPASYCLATSLAMCP